ncbi:hypothetical protein Y032_0045g1283 [Ancylostoma ceylanicum]|nr:hypothetical protein Y032_0045g1283 [Ancylostoma ceylanicum]
MRDLESKLGPDRIEFSSEVRLKMSLTDKFIEAFLDQAKKNPRFDNYVKEDLDPCLGCSEKLSNVKLWRKCDTLGPDEEGNEPSSVCMPCQCRPMWCVSCMARIFLAKQDQSVPTRWLEGNCPCPTCRTTYISSPIEIPRPTCAAFATRSSMECDLCADPHHSALITSAKTF